MNQLTRRIVRSSSAARVALVAAVLSATATAGAQQGSGRWRVEPAVGLWRQTDRGQYTGRRVGPFVGLQMSRQRGSHTRLSASAGYHRLDDALAVVVFSPTGESRTDMYDAEIVSVIAGVAGDLWQSNGTALSLGIEGGPAWNRDRFDRSSGAITGPFVQQPFRDDWTPVFLAVPSLALRREVAARVELTATGRLLLGFGDLSPSTIPTLAAGLGYRF